MRTSGTHIKLADYFRHCQAHPNLEPYLYFTPDSNYSSSVWDSIPPERILRELAGQEFDYLFLTGRDWKLVPPKYKGTLVINLLQSLEQCEPRHKAYKYLKRPAFRICVSHEIEAAIHHVANGETATIENGIPLELFKPAPAKTPGSVLIWGLKQPEFAMELARALQSTGMVPSLMLDYQPREMFAAALAHAEVLVCLPAPVEGFYLPALEGMASGAAVVCADVTGNRQFCHDRNTCLMPVFGDIASHVTSVRKLQEDAELRKRIAEAGIREAARYSIEQERTKFFDLLKMALFNREIEKMK